MDIEFDLYKTYLAAIKNSVGSQIFRHLYLQIEGQEKDAAQGGRLSCAIYVSWLLKIFNSDQQNIHLIKEAHATVPATVKDLIESGWHEITEPKPGAIILWEKQEQAGENPAEFDLYEHIHPHMGFYIGHNIAVSHRDYALTPVEHDWLYDGHRQVEKIFWHDRFNN